MKLIIETQYKENYGAHNMDSFCYSWKFKGGSTYHVSLTDEQLETYRRDVKRDVYSFPFIVRELEKYIAHDDAGSQEYITDHYLVESKWMGPYEESQKEYDPKGRDTFYFDPRLVKESNGVWKEIKYHRVGNFQKKNPKFSHLAGMLQGYVYELTARVEDNAHYDISESLTRSEITWKDELSNNQTYTVDKKCVDKPLGVA